MSRDLLETLVDQYVPFLLEFRKDIKKYIIENKHSFIVPGDLKKTYNNIKFFTELAVDNYCYNLGNYLQEIYSSLLKTGAKIGALYAGYKGLKLAKRKIDDLLDPPEEREKRAEEKLRETARKALMDHIKKGYVSPAPYIHPQGPPYYDHSKSDLVARGGNVGASW